MVRATNDVWNNNRPVIITADDGRGLTVCVLKISVIYEGKTHFNLKIVKKKKKKNKPTHI